MVLVCFFLWSFAANAQFQEHKCASYTFQCQSIDSNSIGQLHPQLQDWLLLDCKDFLNKRGYCEGDSGIVEITLFIWLSTEERVVYEEMYTGSPHQLGVAIPHDMGYRSEKIESLKYINLMLAMTDSHQNLIWKNQLSMEAKNYKSKNSEKRSKRAAKRLVKGIPTPWYVDK
jgi:hypothetical protein